LDLRPEELGEAFDSEMSSALEVLEAECRDLQELADDYLTGGLHAYD
jgi:hypothetical protein